MRKGRMEYAKVGAVEGKFLLSFEEKIVFGTNRGWLKRSFVNFFEKKCFALWPIESYKVFKTL